MEAKSLSETSVVTNLCANHTIDNTLKIVWRLAFLYLVTYSMWVYKKKINRVLTSQWNVEYNMSAGKTDFDVIRPEFSVEATANNKYKKKNSPTTYNANSRRQN
jgi:hypothetical protein